MRGIRFWGGSAFALVFFSLTANAVVPHRVVVDKLRAKSQQMSYDLAKYVEMLDATAASLVDKSPGLGNDYPIWVLPSKAYPEMYVRDSFWTLSGFWHGNHLNTFVDIFSRNSQAAAWQPPLNGQVPTLVRKNVPAPQDARRVDESTMFWVLAAKFAGKTATTEPYVAKAHDFLKQHVTPQGFAMVSHGWIDAWEPVKTPVVSANNQGLYAVTLRALRDMGVAVKPEEIRDADNAYRALFQNGYLNAYVGREVVDVSSLIGEALALYLWDESILGEAIVKGTVAKFKEVFYADGDFLGYKVLSNPDGSYLAESEFWDIAERDPGNYQNGGSWMFYDQLANYAAARHGGDDHYLTRFIGRLKSETKFEFTSKEFVCTGGRCGACTPQSCGGCVNGTCSAGAYNMGRNGYGWNLFVKRLVAGRESFNQQQGD